MLFVITHFPWCPRAYDLDVPTTSSCDPIDSLTDLRRVCMYLCMRVVHLTGGVDTPKPKKSQ